MGNLYLSVASLVHTWKVSRGTLYCCWVITYIHCIVCVTCLQLAVSVAVWCVPGRAGRACAAAVLAAMYSTHWSAGRPRLAVWPPGQKSLECHSLTCCPLDLESFQLVCLYHVTTCSHCSASKQLALCWFPGLAISNAKI